MMGDAQNTFPYDSLLLICSITNLTFQIAGSLVADSEWSQMLDLGLDAINLGLSIITATPCLKGKQTVVLTKHWGDVAPVVYAFLSCHQGGICIFFSDGPEHFFFLSPEATFSMCLANQNALVTLSLCSDS
jgi:hypothetical protein